MRTDQWNTAEALVVLFVATLVFALALVALSLWIAYRLLIRYFEGRKADA